MNTFKNYENKVRPELAEIQYDPFRIPPSLKLAMIHQKAKAVGYIDYMKDYDARQLCPCCNLPYEKTQIPMCSSIKQLGFLGQGYPLYFASIGMYVIFLLILFLIVGVFNIVTTNQQCYSGYSYDLFNKHKNQVNGCYSYLGIMYTTVKSSKDLTVQAILTLIGIIYSSIGLFFIRVHQNRIAIETDFNDTTPGDYTIILKNSQISEFQVRQYFKDNFKIRKNDDNYDVIEFISPQIIRVIIPIRLDEYLQWCDQKSKLLKLQSTTFVNVSSVQELHNKEFDLQENQRELRVLDEKINSFINDVCVNGKGIKCPHILVTFNTQDEVKQILEVMEESFCQKSFPCCNHISEHNMNQKYIDTQKVIMYRAPEPLDLKWENLSVPHLQKVMRRILTILLALLIIVSGAITLYGLAFAQNISQNYESFKDYNVNYLLSFICAILIVIVNRILNYCLYWTSKFEKHSTFTNETIWRTLNLITMQFINTAIIPFALYIITKNNFYQSTIIEQEKFSSNSFIEGIFLIFLGNLFLLPLIVIIDPMYLLRLRKRKQIVSGDAQFTQMDAHIIYEGPDFDISDKLTNINKSILTATFYSAIFPYGTFIQILALIVYYWVSKYILIRRCGWPSNLSANLQQFIQNLMNCIPLTLATGAFCYEYLIQDKNDNFEIHILNYILAFLSLFFIPNIRLKNSIVEDQFPEVSETFEQARLLMPVDYDRANPITRKQAQQDWNNRWRRQQINEEVPLNLVESVLLNQNNQRIQQNMQNEIDLLRPIYTVQQQLQLFDQSNADNNFQRNNLLCASVFIQHQRKMNHIKK